MATDKLHAANVLVPTKVYLKYQPTLRATLSYMNRYFDTLLEVTVNNKLCTWKVTHPSYVIILSDGLCLASNLPQNVLTPWDKSPNSSAPVDLNQWLPSCSFIIIVPLLYKHDVHTVRPLYDMYSRDKVLKQLDTFVDVFEDGNNLRLVPRDASTLYLFSKSLHMFLPFQQAGMYLSPLHHQWDDVVHFLLSNCWHVAVYKLPILRVLY